MTSVPIAGHIVERFLRISGDALDDWHRDGFLACANENRRCYQEADLDRLLAKGERNFAQPPTFADLVAGRVRLLTPPEAAAVLKVSVGSLRSLVRRGIVKAVKYRLALRYCEASVKKRAAVQSGLTTKQVAHIFGVTIKTVDRLEAQDRLARKGSKENRRYSAQGVVALLKEVLPAHQNPHEWIEDRLASARPLLSIAGASPTKDERQRIRSLLKAGELRYIHLVTQPREQRVLISPDSLLAQLQRTQTPLTKGDLARLFGVTPACIHQWDARYKSWRTCHVHEHHDGGLYRDCAIFVLRRYLPVAATVRWYKGRLEYGSPTIGIAATAKILGVTEAEVLKLTAAGRLVALSTPAGTLRFSKTAVLRSKSRCHPKREAARSD